LGRFSRVLSFSLPPDTARKIEDFARSENRSKSELLREMVSVYERFRAETGWREMFIFGEETAKRFKIKDEADLFKILGGAA